MATFLLILWLGLSFLFWTVITAMLALGLFISVVIISGVEWPLKKQMKAK